MQNLPKPNKGLKKTTAIAIMRNHKKWGPDAVLAEIQKMGLQTTRGNLCVLRTGLRKAEPMPDWRELKSPVQKTVLNSKKAAIIRYYFYHPRASVKEIIDALAQDGIRTGKSFVIKNRIKLRGRLGEELDFNRRHRSQIILTEKQKEMIPSFKRIIRWALYQKIFPTLNITTETKREFLEFVEGRLPWLIKNYDQKRAKVSTYLFQKILFLFKDFLRASFEEKIGLPRQDAVKLIKILRLKHQGITTLEELSQKTGIPTREATELLQAYKEFTSGSYRTGKEE